MTVKQDRRGSYWTYNAHSKMQTHTLPSGRSVLNTYDGSDNLIQAQQKDQNGTVLTAIGFTVSASTYGLVTDKYDANNHHYQYGYDANGTLSDLTTPLGHHTHWAYDALGVATGRTDAMNRATAYTLDNWERVTAVTYPDSSFNSTYGYDCNSNLTYFSNYTGASTRTYDAADRMAGENEYGHSVLAHAYDAAGQKGLLSSTTYPYGVTVGYAYTARNEVSGLSGSLGNAAFSYDANGNLTYALQPNGANSQTALDAANRVSSVANSAAGGAWQYNYLYDVDGRKTQEQDLASGSTEAFAYDGLGRLGGDVMTGSNSHANTYSANFSDSYSYNGVGGRTGQSNPFGSATQAYDADDELTGRADGSASYTYDADGEQTASTIQGQGTTFGWDFDGDLMSITNGGGTVSYEYDPLGRQVYRTAGGVSTNYLYDGDRIEAEWVNGSKSVQYLWGPSGLISRNGDYPLTDGRGDVRVATNGSGSPDWYQTPDASGVEWGQGGSISMPYHWGAGSGYRMDVDGPAGGPAVLQGGLPLLRPGQRALRQPRHGPEPVAVCLLRRGPRQLWYSQP